MRTLVWFRSDLRVTDHPALSRAAAHSKQGVIGIFTICPEQWREHDWAPVKVEFILRTLRELKRELHKLGIPLLIETLDRFDDVPELLLEVMLKHECAALYFNREYEVNERQRDDAVQHKLTKEGLDVCAFTDQVIVPPGAMRTKQGSFYTVFTPFRKRWIERVEESGIPARLRRPQRQERFPVKSDDVPEQVEGFPASGIAPTLWPAGEREAARRLRSFQRNIVEGYRQDRNHPARDGTSVLSPYLTVGAISMRTCLHAAFDANGRSLANLHSGAGTWISQLVWREFYRHILVGFPRVSMHQPFNIKTRTLRWRKSDRDFEAWCAGHTGVPIVDAGMRQLAQTGWMHNRLRMITAMFLTKDLLIDWCRGERWFMQHLIDGDLASNNGGWQWAASTGTDAAPYFRIFNPITQSRKFDPDGAFIRQYVPELRELDDKSIHEPFDSKTPPRGLNYPPPIVDHSKARERAVRAFKSIS